MIFGFIEGSFLLTIESIASCPPAVNIANKSGSPFDSWLFLFFNFYLFIYFFVYLRLFSNLWSSFLGLPSAEAAVCAVTPISIIASLQWPIRPPWQILSRSVLAYFTPCAQFADKSLQFVDPALQLRSCFFSFWTLQHQCFLVVSVFPERCPVVCFCFIVSMGLFHYGSWGNFSYLCSLAFD